MTTTIDLAPGAVIADPRIRRGLGLALYLLSLLAGIAALTFSFFPELAQGTDIPSRAIGLANGVVSLLSRSSTRSCPVLRGHVERDPTGRPGWILLPKCPIRGVPHSSGNPV